MAVAAAAARRTARGGAPARMTAASVGGTSLGLFWVEAVLGERDGPDAAPQQPAGMAAASLAPGGAAAGRDGGGARVSAASSAPARRPPKAAVLVVSDQLEGASLTRAMGAAPGVTSVVQDRVIAVAQASSAGGWRPAH
jgi:hypothetical protein